MDNESKCAAKQYYGTQYQQFAPFAYYNGTQNLSAQLEFQCKRYTFRKGKANIRFVFYVATYAFYCGGHKDHNTGALDQYNTVLNNYTENSFNLMQKLHL